MGSNLEQKFKLWERPTSVEIRVFQNNLIGICPTMNTTCDQSVSSVWHCLLELLPQNQKYCQTSWILYEKKSYKLFLPSNVKNSKYPEAETWHPENIDGWSY